MSKEFEKPKRYVPGPGDPALPPQLAQLSEKTTEDVMKELNRSPFFMTQLDESNGDGGENVELEALKALAYEGSPYDVAINFKNQGNEQFKIKQYKSAIEFYNKGLAMNCLDENLVASLFLNRAACNLELKNYRTTINDCRECLKINPRNVKAFYRMSKAFFAIEKFDESIESLQFSLALDPENLASKQLLNQIEKRKHELETLAAKREAEILRKQILQDKLKTAINGRNYTIIKTARPAEMLSDAKLSLEDPDDIESQLIFPAMIIYPTTDEFDFVASVSELSSPWEIMELVLQRPEEWFKDPKHENFSPKKLDAYMESESGGLIKIGKKATLNKALSTLKPKIPLFDDALKIYFVPRIDAEKWLSSWDKEVTLKKRYDASI
ncbi:Tetratricopeptide repeat protein [Wickerhamomyces ciferrii]|uniref:Tetratricopeptide repeat protein n=1 Tax=Wickerhamomyces ciferrii (strain ATCC 14091 / BCRC 22168 / CBS 111 / JCM 3599 / NBRC 0793 / NRRL Y-1031 F-60-10) TaxID=1206466 RepID=K0KKT1_WICCF|nr:Tetratricopeptide repeat protein [Wickerhamomyces ciferrii]CCH43616.1 Tetratricopeptide repeat protein [Wickerhamomyces ciferrii]